MPPKKQPQKQRVAPVQTESLEHEFSPLLGEEREKLNQIFADPVFRKAWRNMHHLRPTSFVGTSGELGNQAAINRFHEQRGWEAWGKAFIAQSKEPKPKPQRPQESFPDGGTIDAAFKLDAALKPK